MSRLAIFAFALAADLEPRWLQLNDVTRNAVQAKNYAKLRETLLELQAAPRQSADRVQPRCQRSHVGASRGCYYRIAQLGGYGPHHRDRRRFRFRIVARCPGIWRGARPHRSRQEPVTYSTLESRYLA
jgi:hypothetical protein